MTLTRKTDKSVNIILKSHLDHKNEKDEHYSETNDSKFIEKKTAG